MESVSEYRWLKGNLILKKIKKRLKKERSVLVKAWFFLTCWKQKQGI